VKLVDDLTGESPVSAGCPVGTVVISGGGAGDQTVESPEVNALVGWMEIRSAPTGGLATQQVVAQANRSEASKIPASPESECEDVRERRNCYTELKASVSGEALGFRSRRVPRGLGGRHVAKERQRKLRTGCGLPRHVQACTAMAFRINRETAKSECACNWGGWGRLSVDGPGQHNPDRSEGPWGRAAGPLARRRL
jgi:hypothetical protein